MPKRYEIYVDEAWTHSEPKQRYWCFYGGIFGEQSSLSRLDTRLRSVLKKERVNGEIKWQQLNARNALSYRNFVDCLLDAIRVGEVKFRQMLCDRASVRVQPQDESSAK